MAMSCYFDLTFNKIKAVPLLLIDRRTAFLRLLTIIAQCDRVNKYKVAVIWDRL